MDCRSLSRSLPAVFLAVLLTGTGVDAQRTLRGVVVDSVGLPLGNVEIRIMELGRLTRTDSVGRFMLASIKERVVDITARRLGYQMRFMRISMINGEGDSLRVILFPEPVRLAGVAIEAPEEIHPYFAEYEGRRSRGIGTFITKQQIEKLNTSYPSDAFRALPGMKLVRVNGGHGVRFMSTVGMRRSGGGECVPMIWLDGQAAPGMEIDELRAQDIEGIEIYRGASTTPPQFARSGATQCGSVVIWTKRRK